MGPRHEFHLDPDHARQLAAELYRSGEFSPAPPPALPEAPVLTRFLSAANAALVHSTDRGTAACDRARELAESSFSSISTHEDSDTHFADLLGRL